MDGWVWSNGGMVLTGENWSVGRKTLYSVGGRWMDVCGGMVELYWQGKTVVLGEKRFPLLISPLQIPLKITIYTKSLIHKDCLKMIRRFQMSGNIYKIPTAHNTMNVAKFRKLRLVQLPVRAATVNYVTTTTPLQEGLHNATGSVRCAESHDIKGSIKRRISDITVCVCLGVVCRPWRRYKITHRMRENEDKTKEHKNKPKL